MFGVIFDDFDQAVEYYYANKQDLSKRTAMSDRPLLMRFVIDNSTAFELLNYIVDLANSKSEDYKGPQINALVTNFFDLEKKV